MLVVLAGVYFGFGPASASCLKKFYHNKRLSEVFDDLPVVLMEKSINFIQKFLDTRDMQNKSFGASHTRNSEKSRHRKPQHHDAVVVHVLC